LTVFLKKGPTRNQDNISAEKIQAAHLANINSLAKEIMASPVMTYYPWWCKRENIFSNKKKAAPIMELL